MPDNTRVPRGTTMPRHRLANPAVSRPVGHDLGRSQEPKLGGLHKWWRRWRGSGWSMRGRGVGPRPGGRRGGVGPRRRTSAGSAQPSPGSAPAPPTSATLRRRRVARRTDRAAAAEQLHLVLALLPVPRFRYQPGSRWRPDRAKKGLMQGLAVSTSLLHIINRYYIIITSLLLCPYYSIMGKMMNNML